MVKFMVDSMAKCGCPIRNPSQYFLVRQCEEKVGGGFDPHAANTKDQAGGVVLCSNHIRDYEHAGIRIQSTGLHVRQTLIHS